MINIQAQLLHLVYPNCAHRLVEYIRLAQGSRAHIQDKVGTKTVDPPAAEIVGVVVGWLVFIGADHVVDVMDEHLREAEEDVISLGEAVINARRPSVRVVDLRPGLNEIISVRQLRIGSQQVGLQIPLHHRADQSAGKFVTRGSGGLYVAGIDGRWISECIAEDW